MSFFATKLKVRKTKVRAIDYRGSRQNAEALRRIGCSACPLNKADVITPKMSPTLVKGGKVYFLAEAPGRDEDENTGRPLTGPSGRLLRDCIPDEWEAECSFDNVVNCRPPGNRTPVWNEIECCRPRRDKFVQEAKPLLIVGLGAIPLQAMLGSQDLAGMRGRFFAVKFGGHACWFMPTYHPSFILRVAQNKRKPLHSMMGHCLRMDLKRAFEWAEWLEPPEILDEKSVRSGIQCFEGTSPDQLHDVLRLLQEVREAKEKAVDLETKGLRPYKPDAAIMSCAFSFDSINFAFALDHPKAGWTPAQKVKIKAALKTALLTGVKIAHGSPFEIEWLIWYFGREIIQHGQWHCTMSQAHFLDERKGKFKDDDDTKASRYQGLNFLVGQYFGLQNFKKLFRLDKKDMSKSDIGETLVYNGSDTLLTLLLYYIQEEMLKRVYLYKAWKRAQPLQTTVAVMQSIGVPVDQAEVKKQSKRLEAEIKPITEKIQTIKVVQAFIKDNGEFNPQSDKQVLSIFKDYLKRPEVKKINNAGNETFSVDKGVLEQIDHPLASLVLGLRNKAKMKSTYIDELELGKGSIIYPDNRLHTQFATVRTETGRLSSLEPNLQNYPKRKDPWTRKVIVPPKNHLMVAVDYGQLEACTGAMCSQDGYLTNALWNDYDTHYEWAKRTGAEIPELIGGKQNLNDKGIMKDFRGLIKNKLVFPSFYGARNDSVADYLTKATGYEVPQHKVDKIMKEFWNTFNGVAKWQEDTMDKYYDVGYVETLLHRRHHYPLTRNEALNMPWQGTAAELVCDANTRLSILAQKRNEWHLHPVLNVHDDLSFFIPDSDSILNDALNIIMREMLTFSFEWINVPLSIEISIGPNWADLKPLGKFFSHKEFGYPRRMS